MNDQRVAGTFKNLPPCILASASPRRAQLLRELGLEFRIVNAAVNETALDYLTPKEMVQLNAQRKAHAVAKQYPRSLVLGADTEVCLGNQVFGKPADYPEATRMLGQLQGRWHQVMTGVCLVWREAKREKLFVVATRVKFRALDEAQIAQYLHHIHPYDKAGAYAIQEHGELIVAALEGSLTNVIGLPLEGLKEELEKF